MNYKQALLQSPQIDAVRDKTLSFGCEIQTGYGVVKYTTDEDYLRRESTAAIVANKLDVPNPFYIIGHPITHADLLRALQPVDNQIDFFSESELEVVQWNETFDGATQVIVPLNYRTIEDIPECDIMWKQLCKVFNLV